MPARRFFVRDRREVGERVTIEGADAHKIAGVLRLRSGDSIDVVDSAAQVFTAVLQIDGSRVTALLSERTSTLDESHALRIDVAQAVPKGSKMDYVVEKLSEIGVERLLPFRSERVIASDTGDAKRERWHRLAHAAAAQSGRVRVMDVDPPMGFAELIARFTGYDVVLMPWETSRPRPLSSVLPSLIEGRSHALIVIGPEGGFSHDEAAQAQSAGAHLISLGSQILRTETAGLVTAAILRYESDR